MAIYAYATGTISDELFAQWRCARDWVLRAGIETFGAYADPEPTASTEQLHLQKMLIEILKNRGTLIVQSLPNLTTSSIRATSIISQCLRAGARFVSVLDGIDTAGPEAPGIKCLAQALNAQNRRLGHARIRKLEALRAAGRAVGTAPYGQKRSNDGISLIQDDNEMDVIGTIIRLRRQAHTYAQIAAQLDALRYSPRLAKHWSSKVVMSIYKRHEDARSIIPQQARSCRPEVPSPFDIAIAEARLLLKIQNTKGATG